jgi:hypothetical protein
MSLHNLKLAIFEFESNEVTWQRYPKKEYSALLYFQDLVKSSPISCLRLPHASIIKFVRAQCHPLCSATLLAKFGF